jgi:hypothetical protein
VPAPEFVALADVLRAGVSPARSSLVPAALPAEEDAAELGSTVRTAEAPHDISVADIGQPDITAAAREARLFRARLADALDDALARLLREIAADVLARELRLAPCDVAEIARRALERAPVVRVRVASADAGNAYGLPVVADPELHAGDAVFELDGGALDARLGVRLASVLDAVCATVLASVSATVPLGVVASRRDGAVR